MAASFSFAQLKPSGDLDVARCWSYPLKDAAGTRIATDGQRVILGRDGGRIEALSPEGKKIWSSEFGGEISSNLLPTDTGLFFVTSTIPEGAGKDQQSILRMVSKETGVTNWTQNVPSAQSHYLSESNGSLVVVSKSGTIQAIDAKNGTLKWKREIAEGFTAEPAFTTDKLFVATTNKQVFEISLGSGQIDSLRTFPNDLTAIAAAGGMLIVGDDRGNVSVLDDGINKPRWKFRAGGEISAVLGLGENLLVASHDNFVYCLGVSRGGLVWKKRLTGRASYVSGSLGTYVVVASLDSHSIQLLDASTGKVSGQIVLGEEETLVSATVAANRLIYTLTQDGAGAFASNGCSPTKSDGPGK